MSKKRSLDTKDLKALGINFIKFVAPTLALFFNLLAQGVPLSKAWPVAAFALYQSLSDLLTKWSKGR